MSSNKYLSLFFSFLISCCFYTTLVAQFPVGHSSVSFTDPARANRQVTAEVYYPATTTGDNTPVANGQFPLVIFGHGFVMAWSEYSVWWENVVPEGYIMVFPTTEGGFSPDHGDLGTDMSFLVDTYLSENVDNTATFFQKLNEKVAVMGHSMGGGASFLATAQNPNITAHLSLAAAETTPSAIGAAASITVPSLVIASSKDCVTPPVDHQIPMYNALGAPYKAYVEITDANHCNYGIATPFSNCVFGEMFAGSCSNFISKADQHTRMLAISQPWLDYWLKCDCAAWDTFYDYMTTSNTHTYEEAGIAPLNYPTNIAASNEMDTSVELTWDAVDGAMQYNITYCEQGTSNCTTVTTSSTSINLSGLNANTTYEYTLSADCGNGNAAASPMATFMTTDSGCPAFLTLNNTLNNGTYTADIQLTADDAIVPANGMVTFHAGTCIDLLPNFEVVQGAVFLIEIEGCTP